MIRRSRDVVQELLDEMNGIVSAYPDGVERTGATVDELIDGTACFPGGSGLWRGDCYDGPLPETFPESSVLFVGHNFDSIEAHKEAMDQGGEVGTLFWRTLKSFLGVAALDPAGCVFSNALMGLKPGSANGPMPDCKDYRPQCQHFLRRQIEIVRPSTIIVLGDDAAVQLRKARKRDAAGAAIRFEKMMHPSTRPVNQRPSRDEWILAQGQKIAAAMAAHSIPFDSFR